MEYLLQFSLRRYGRGLRDPAKALVRASVVALVLLSEPLQSQTHPTFISEMRVLRDKYDVTFVYESSLPCKRVIILQDHIDFYFVTDELDRYLRDSRIFMEDF